MLKQYKLKDYDFRLVAYVVVLTIIGILVIGSATQLGTGETDPWSGLRTDYHGGGLADGL